MQRRKPQWGLPIPVSAPTPNFHLVVLPANIATSIPYRQYCFAHHSSRLRRRSTEADLESSVATRRRLKRCSRAILGLS